MSKIKAPTPPENMIRHNVFMPSDFLAALRELAEEKGGTAADHLRRAVATYLRRYKKLA